MGLSAVLLYMQSMPPFAHELGVIRQLYNCTLKYPNEVGVRYLLYLFDRVFYEEEYCSLMSTTTCNTHTIYTEDAYRSWSKKTGERSLSLACRHRRAHP